MAGKIRHTILLLTLCFLMASCNSQEPEIHTERGAMEFDIAGISRAVSTTSHNITESSFAIYGDMTFVKNQNTTVVFDGETATFSLTDNKWHYSNTQYWFPDHEHSFVALHPAGSPCVSDIQYSDSQLQFTYTYPFDNYSDAKDVLVATHRRDYTEGNADAVRFIFSHTLSNMNVQFIYYNPNRGAVPLRLNSITFKNIPVAATYAVAPAKLAGGSMTNDFAGDMAAFEGVTVTGRGDLKIDFDGDRAISIPPDGRPYNLFSDSDVLLLLPNPDTSSEMVVSYTTCDGGVWQDNTAEFDLPISWRPGFNYTLSISDIQDQLKFSIEVTPWKDGDTTNSIVPRK